MAGEADGTGEPERRDDRDVRSWPGETEQYPSSAVRPTRWGTIRQAADGTWETVWDLTFDGLPLAPGGTADILRDDALGFTAVLRATGPGAADLFVVTEEHAMAAEYYPPTFAAFGIVNDTVATIRTIRGLPRDWYAPFRNRPTPHSRTDPPGGAAGKPESGGRPGD